MCRGSVLAFTEVLQSEPAAEQGRCYMEDIMLGASANDSTSNRPVVLTSDIMKTLEVSSYTPTEAHIGPPVVCISGEHWHGGYSSLKCFLIQPNHPCLRINLAALERSQLSSPQI